MCIGLLSDIRDNVDPRSILDDDSQRVVEVGRIGSRLLRGCVTADEHNVLADDVEGDDDGLADERGAAAADKGPDFIVTRYFVGFLKYFKRNLIM